MKYIAFLLFFTLSFVAQANNIIVNGTRFIYPENEKEITVQLSNNADRPALAQVWLDNGNADATPDTITTPFSITPPISRVDAKGGQTLRIKLNSKSNLAKNKETLWWLNLLEIPPVEVNSKNEGQNVLQLAIRSRFKFIYRPVGLGNRDSAPEKFVISAKGKMLSVKNPSPFYLTISSISDKSGKPLSSKAVMVAPFSSADIPVSSSVTQGEVLTLNNINDYGANIPVKITVK